MVLNCKIINNPDKVEFNKVLQALKENGGYCPCKMEKMKIQNVCV